MKKKELEKNNRIRLLLAAYSYEMLNHSIMSDGEYDELANSIDLKQGTGNRKLDKWFRENFQPHTAQWIYTYPELEKLIKLYNKLYLEFCVVN